MAYLAVRAAGPAGVWLGGAFIAGAAALGLALFFWNGKAWKMLGPCWRAL